MKKKTAGVVLESNEIAADIFEMWIKTELAYVAMPGQFVGIFSTNAATLLPRPISICETDKKKGAIRLVYRIAGQGTREFSHYKAGRRVFLLGVLGNGYPLDKAMGKQVILMGGGIGIPPIVELAKRLSGYDENIGTFVKPIANKITSVIGYRDNNLFLKEELEQYGDVLVATEDGSIGVKGNIIDVVNANKLNVDLIYSCGPMMMLKAIKHYTLEKDITAYISLEERMACGVGACLGCVCKTANKDAHSQVHNARICTDGPVFDAREVLI